MVVPCVIVHTHSSEKAYWPKHCDNTIYLCAILTQLVYFSLKVVLGNIMWVHMYM